MSTGLLPEWAHTEAVLLAWPHAGTDWAPWLDVIEPDYVELVTAIAAQARPLILCCDEVLQQKVSTLLAGRCMHQPFYVITGYNDTWCRDYGPLTINTDTGLKLINFRFSGWGNKFEASLDDQVTGQLQPFWKVPVLERDFELEGGSIDSDGKGSLLSTHHCLLDSKRNTDLTRADKETMVLDTLGQQRILWLSEGYLAGDDTDSHIDNLVRFCSEDSLAFITCSNESDEHYEPLQKLETQVRRLKQQNGQPYRLFPVELPAPQFETDGTRLPASYVNFLILNDTVLVPVFSCAQDASALNVLQKAFPDKTLVPVPGNNLIRQFGGPHCATMQLPVGVTKL